MSTQLNIGLIQEETQLSETEQKNTNSQFMDEFENCTFPPESFNHEGHLKITWLYLKSFPIDEAVDKVMVGIKRYAEHLGANEKYHATLTWFMVHLINNRIALDGNVAWPEFKMQNQALFNNAKVLVGQYYSESLIASEQARKQLLMPDLIKPVWLPDIVGEK